MMKKHKSWNIGYSFAGALLFGALATLPVGAQTAYQSIIAAQSPNDYWRFNETVASPALNIVTNWGSAGASGNGYVCTTGIPTGFGVTGSNGVVGNGVYISNPGQSAGDVYSRIDIPNIPALNTPPPFAVEFWMMPNSPFSPSDVASGPGLAPISSLSIYPGDGSRSGYTFYVEPNAVEIRIGGPASYSAIALYNLPKGQTVSTTSFSHVVGQFDGTTLSLYLNGVLVASASAVGAPPLFA